MARVYVTKLSFIAVVVFLLLTLPTETARHFQRRYDLALSPPVAESNYTVPLQAGLTCSTTGACTSDLPAPPKNKSLKILALARGIITYSCENRGAAEPPIYLSQTTSLWDAAPLIPHIANEDLFHTIIPQLYEFDYTKLANSTLVCIGIVETVDGQSIVDIFNIETFAVSIQQQVDAPDLVHLNLDWTHETSQDLAWDIYRVKTVGGDFPGNCDDRDGLVELDYAAEYWFYHT